MIRAYHEPIPSRELPSDWKLNTIVKDIPVTWKQRSIRYGIQVIAILLVAGLIGGGTALFYNTLKSPDRNPFRLVGRTVGTATLLVGGVFGSIGAISLPLFVGMATYSMNHPSLKDEKKENAILSHLCQASTLEIFGGGLTAHEQLQKELLMEKFNYFQNPVTINAD